MSVKRIKASEQGDLDGACGFYAVVNALRSLEPDLNAKELFTQTIKAHVVDGNPMSFVEGTRRGTIKDVLSRVLDYIHSHYSLTDNASGDSYIIESKFPYWHLGKERSRDEVISVLKSADFKSGVVCIIGYDYNSGIENDSPYSHWSVVSKANELGLHLIDSSEEKKFISFDEVRVDSVKQKHNSARPYNICSGDVIVVSRITK